MSDIHMRVLEAVRFLSYPNAEKFLHKNHVTDFLKSQFETNYVLAAIETCVEQSSLELDSDLIRLRLTVVGDMRLDEYVNKQTRKDTAKPKWDFSNGIFEIDHETVIRMLKKQ